MTNHEALLQSIVENPEDDAARLVYADWLEEHGQPERAEFLRAQMELATLPEGNQRRPALKARLLALLGRLMQPVHWGRWQLRCDPLTTRLAYAQVATSSPELCLCDPCRNFAAARDLAYPADALALFRQVGIDPCWEAERYHMCRLDSGHHLYGGWFHFVGTIESGTGAFKSDGTWDGEGLSDRFSLGFVARSNLLRLPALELPLVQLEFTTCVPWMLDVAEPQ